eukprot:1149102-Pelagomonas_calceolata.AAC.4
MRSLGQRFLMLCKEACLQAWQLPFLPYANHTDCELDEELRSKGVKLPCLQYTKGKKREGYAFQVWLRALRTGSCIAHAKPGMSRGWHTIQKQIRKAENAVQQGLPSAHVAALLVMQSTEELKKDKMNYARKPSLHQFRKRRHPVQGGVLAVQKAKHPVLCIAVELRFLQASEKSDLLNGLHHSSYEGWHAHANAPCTFAILDLKDGHGFYCPILKCSMDDLCWCTYLLLTPKYGKNCLSVNRLTCSHAFAHEHGRHLWGIHVIDLQTKGGKGTTQHAVLAALHWSIHLMRLTGGMHLIPGKDLLVRYPCLLDIQSGACIAMVWAITNSAVVNEECNKLPACITHMHMQPEARWQRHEHMYGVKLHGSYVAAVLTCICNLKLSGSKINKHMQSESRGSSINLIP